VMSVNVIHSGQIIFKPRMAHCEKKGTLMIYAFRNSTVKMQWTLEKRRQVYTFHNLTRSGERFLAGLSRKTTIHGPRRTIQAGRRQVVKSCLFR
jgi:hypothetical protein